MRRIHDVLRFHHELGMGQREIARSLQMSQSTVHQYLHLFTNAGLNWPLPEGWNEARIESALFGDKQKAPAEPARQPDFAHIEKELRQHRDLTLELLWREYRNRQPGGYSYSRYCVLYRQWKRSQDLVLRQNHRAGEKMFVDWAGATIPIHDPQGGPVVQAPVFVAVLGASAYAYAEVARNQQMEAWLGAHMRAFEFFEGVPEFAVIDNTKTGVSKACRYDPELNPTYQEFALHYTFGVLVARPYKPRDKAPAEAGVQVVQRWILAALRHRRFFHHAEAGLAVRELLSQLNQRPFRKRAGCRQSVFLELDKPALKPLPAERYDLSQWSEAKVHIDYHVAADGNFYSAPYGLVGKPVDVRLTPTTVEIFHKGERVASHIRSRKTNFAVTTETHRPPAHQAHLEWPPERLVEWARQVGARTAALVERILERYPHPQMGYRGCLGLIRLAKQYTAARMEAAAERALATGACRYASVKSILANGLDQLPLPAGEPASPPGPDHDNIRGPQYFE